MKPVISNSSVLSLTSLATNAADTALPAGNHLRWFLTPEFGLPHAGFRLRRRPSPKWPWPAAETDFARLTARNVATSRIGAHITEIPVRAEGARLTNTSGLVQTNRRAPMRFFYEAREHSDPQNQTITRFVAMVQVFAGAIQREGRIRAVVRRGNRDITVAERRVRMGALPGFGGSDPKDHRAFTIAANEADWIEITLPQDAVILGVGLATADKLHRQKNWQTIKVFGPPCMAGTAGVAAPTDLDAEISDRLKATQPLRRAGAPDVPGAGRRLSLRDHVLFARKVLRDAQPLAESLTRAYGMELQDVRPPQDITLSDIDPAAEGRMDIPFYGVLQAGAHATHIAALLGLATQDTPAPHETGYDYAIDTLLPALYVMLQALTDPESIDRILSQMPPAAVALPADPRVYWDTTPNSHSRFAAFAVETVPQAPQPIFPPALTVEDVPDGSRTPIQSRLKITVRPGARDQRSYVWLRRGDKVTALGEIDPTTGLALPVLAGPDGTAQVETDALEDYGAHTVIAMDVDTFGRLSKTRQSSITVKNRVPPPAPSMPEITLGAPSSADALTFPEASLATRWTAGQRTSAPDLLAIDFIWKAGDHEAQAILARPDGKLPLQRPLTGATRVGEDHIILGKAALTLGHDPVARRREISAVAVARDAAGNTSAPSAVGRVALVDTHVPPTPVLPPEPQWTSWPDREGLVRWSLDWQVPPGASHARVSTATEARLIALSGRDAAAHYDQSHARRAETLKTLAIAHPQAFRPEGPAIPSSITSHDIVLTAGSDDLVVTTLSFLGATGQLSPWPDTPDRFAVIRARGSATLVPPRVRIEQIDGADHVSIEFETDAEAELFTVSRPEQLAALDVVPPIAQGGRDGQLDHVQQRSPTETWLGYVARQRAKDGRVSAASKILWRLPQRSERP